jgi:hypothetical protein
MRRFYDHWVETLVRTLDFVPLCCLPHLPFHFVLTTTTTKDRSNLCRWQLRKHHRLLGSKLRARSFAHHLGVAPQWNRSLPGISW